MRLTKEIAASTIKITNGASKRNFAFSLGATGSSI